MSIFSLPGEQFTAGKEMQYDPSEPDQEVGNKLELEPDELKDSRRKSTIGEHANQPFELVKEGKLGKDSIIDAKNMGCSEKGSMNFGLPSNRTSDDIKYRVKAYLSKLLVMSMVAGSYFYYIFQLWVVNINKGDILMLSLSIFVISLITSIIIFSFNIFWINSAVNYSSAKYIVASILLLFSVLVISFIWKVNLLCIVIGVLISGYYRGASYSILALLSKRLSEHCIAYNMKDACIIITKYHSILKVLSSSMGILILAISAFFEMGMLPTLGVCTLLYGIEMVYILCERKICLEQNCYL